MTEQRIPFSIREEARMGLQDWWADRIDTALINQLTGYTAQTDTRFTGNQATIAPTTTTRALIGQAVGPTTEASLSNSATHTFSLACIDRAVVAAKTATPLIRTLSDDMYVCFIHPYQAYQLRTTTSTGQFLDIQKAAMTGGNVTKNPIFTGALGVYNQTIIVETPRIPVVATGESTGTGSTAGRRAVFCGAQAAIFAVGQDNSPEKMTWVEELFDYENQLGVSAGMIFGAKKAVFNSTDFGTITISTYSPAP